MDGKVISIFCNNWMLLEAVRHICQILSKLFMNISGRSKGLSIIWFFLFYFFKQLMLNKTTYTYRCVTMRLHDFVALYQQQLGVFSCQILLGNMHKISHLMAKFTHDFSFYSATKKKPKITYIFCQWLRRSMTQRQFPLYCWFLRSSNISESFFDFQ